MGRGPRNAPAASPPRPVNSGVHRTLVQLVMCVVLAAAMFIFARLFTLDASADDGATAMLTRTIWDSRMSRTTAAASRGCNLTRMTTCSQKLAARGITDACKLAKVGLACFSDECKSGAYRAAWTTAETTAKTACASTGGGGTLIGTSSGGAGPSSSSSHVPPAAPGVVLSAFTAAPDANTATFTATTAITTPATNAATATDTPTTLTTPHPKFNAVGVNPWIDATEQHCSRSEIDSADTSISDLCTCVEEFAAKYKHCTALGDPFVPTQFAGAAVNSAEQNGGVVYQVLPMPSYLDAAMLLWGQHNDGGPDVASDFDAAADMRRSKARFLRDVFLTNTNPDNTSIAFDCRSLRMVWATRARILDSNDDVIPPCYDTCISARDGKCDELQPTRVNGKHISTVLRQAGWACAPGTDGSDCGCVQPRRQATNRGQQKTRNEKRSGLGRSASDGVRGDSTAKHTTLKIWSNDFHTGLVGDLKHFLPRFVAPKLGSHTHTVHIEWLDRSFSAYCALQQPPTCAITEPSKATREKNAKAQVAAAAAVTAAKAKVAAAQTTVATTTTAAAAAKAAYLMLVLASKAKVAADSDASAAKANIHGLTRDTAWAVSMLTCSYRTSGAAPCLTTLVFFVFSHTSQTCVITNLFVGPVSVVVYVLSSSPSLTPSLSLLRTDVSLAGQVPAECLGSQQKRFRHINSRRFLRCASCVWFACLDSVRQAYYRDRGYHVDEWLPSAMQGSVYTAQETIS